jgi:hypothetical protein
VSAEDDPSAGSLQELHVDPRTCNPDYHDAVFVPLFPYLEASGFPTATIFIEIGFFPPAINLLSGGRPLCLSTCLQIWVLAITMNGVGGLIYSFGIPTVMRKPLACAVYLDLT